ncbi:hypothetical protein [Kitasatospora sp. NPDC059817]|uniref:hypothetical protein n=1 Tax=Kitasatospora sp. NPDC059817 TaxID=3346961 RepID=UPI00364F34AF
MGGPTKWRFLVFNVEHDLGGWRTKEWEQFHEWVRKLNLVAFLRQEMTHSATDGRRGFHAARQALGMCGFMAAKTNPESPNPPAVFLRENALFIAADYPQIEGWWLPAAQGRIQHLGREGGPELALASIHLDPNSPTQRLIEAERAVKWGATKQIVGTDGELYQVVQPCILGGDLNSYSSSPDELIPPPDFSTVLDKQHVVNRTLRDRATPDTGPWDTFTTAGFADLAHHAYAHLRQKKALIGTTHYRTDQGARTSERHPRIDFLFGNGCIPQALEKVEIVESPVKSRIDHYGILATFDPGDLWDAVEETARPRLIEEVEETATRTTA